MIDSANATSQRTMQLWIVRHAEAAPAEHGSADFQRPLTPRGIADATRLRRHLETLHSGPVPGVERIVASDSRRTRATAELLAPAFGHTAASIQFDHRIYDAGADTLLDIVWGASLDAAGLMLVGHNPGVTALASRLCRPERIRGLPPLGTVALDLSVADMHGSRTAVLRRYIDPHALDLSVGAP
jgi:phosphohistidine phosphatase SixA